MTLREGADCDGGVAIACDHSQFLRWTCVYRYFRVNSPFIYCNGAFEVSIYRMGVLVLTLNRNGLLRVVVVRQG